MICMLDFLWAGQFSLRSPTGLITALYHLPYTTTEWGQLLTLYTPYTENNSLLVAPVKLITLNTDNLFGFSAVIVDPW